MPTLTVTDGALLRDGRPHRLVSGALHYFRIHPDLWEDRLARVRAMGVNTVETYVAWNRHERVRGRFDFTGGADLARFVRTAGDVGLDVIVRPGPYICAEWDFGGLPAWLMNEPDLQLRTSDPAFLRAVDDWFDALLPEVRPLLATNGGPVVAVQVENEYGAYGEDTAYLRHVKDRLVEGGVDVLLFTTDGARVEDLEAGCLPGVLATGTFGSRSREHLAALAEHRPDEPLVCMEFWNGWFDHWGEQHHVRDAADVAGEVEELLSLGGHLNFYMAHGGTNFGLWNGSNLEPGTGRLQPTVTSYDYDAPVGEAGELTDTFWAVREVLGRHVAGALPEPPPLAERQRPQSVDVDRFRRLLDAPETAGTSRTAPHPLTIESLGVDHGLMVYRATTRVPAAGADLTLEGLKDRATVLVDGTVVGVVDRNDAGHTLRIDPPQAGAAGARDLVVVVENQGRVNFSEGLGERKGLTGVRLGRRYVMGWESTAVPLDRDGLTDDLVWGEPGAAGAPTGASGPVFARAHVEVEAPADAFLALPGWGKGMVWLNGFMLGRYWEVGPQVTLYAPAPLWRAGSNEIVVLELETPGRTVEVRDEPDLGPRGDAGPETTGAPE